MQFKHRLILMFTDNCLGTDITMKCKHCKRKTLHRDHGFRGHNYRITCMECGEINYCEYQ